MREIKFRGIDCETNSFVYGHYFDNKINDYIITIDDNDDGDELSHTLNKIITGTLGQYTGLKDKNGVEIYEGDILREYSNEIEDWEVSYEYGKFVGTFENVCEDLYELSDLEVIGNIYENEKER